MLTLYTHPTGAGFVLVDAHGHASALDRTAAEALRDQLTVELKRTAPKAPRR